MGTARNKEKIVLVALLRGINVGNAKRISMSTLRQVVTDIGFTDVQTLLNSGNVVFRSTQREAAGAAERIHEALKASLDVESRVIVLTAAELSQITARNPLQQIADNPSHMLVGVLADAADRAKLAAIAATDWEGERIVLGASRAVYMWMAEGVIKSKLNAAVGKSLRDGITARNWATMMKLKAMTQAGED